MGGRGGSSGRKNEYKSTGEIISGFKVIEHKSKPNAPLPQMSNTPGTVYILKSNGKLKSLGIYGMDKRLSKEINIDHGHKNRYKSGKKEDLKRGVAHVHHWKGGRNANVRYMTKKEIKKYGSAITQMGGKIYE